MSIFARDALWVRLPHFIHFSACAAGQAGENAALEKVFLVKVGGYYGTFAHEGIIKMDRMGLLEALADSRGFSKLKNVALDECAVFVSRSPQEHELTEAERSATVLLYDNTIGSLVGDASRVFIRVDVPVAGGGGECCCVDLMRECADPFHAFLVVAQRRQRH